MFLIIAITHKRFLQSTPEDRSCNMLFGTWSQAHAYDPSDYIEIRLELYLVNELNRLLVGP